MSEFWDDFFIHEARRISRASKDPSSKVGCIITDKNYTPISRGINKFPAGANHSLLSWERPAKYEFVIHAEMDALRFFPETEGAMAFLTDAPCGPCLKHLIHSGVKRVIYGSVEVTKRWVTTEQAKALTSLIEASGAEVRNINGKDFISDLKS